MIDFSHELRTKDTESFHISNFTFISSFFSNLSPKAPKLAIKTEWEGTYKVELPLHSYDFHTIIPLYITQTPHHVCYTCGET